jgi:hypothetical protein
VPGWLRPWSGGLARFVSSSGGGVTRSLDAGSARAGIEPEEFVERLLESNDLQPLIARVLDAAARTNSAWKLRVLGTMLGEAVSDRPPLVDDHALFVSALDELGPVHLRVLEALEQRADPSNPNFGWTGKALESAISDVSLVAVQAAVGGLVRHGLVRMEAGYGLHYEISELGAAFMEVIRLTMPEPGG